jgi:RNA polymerase sigma factor (sigma-70 family)
MTKHESLQIKDINLIRKIVWSFKRHSNESFEDLFQEGYIGYIHAIETYDPGRGAFSTHAWHCISSKLKDYAKHEVKKNGHLTPSDLSQFDIAIPQSDFFDQLPIESMDMVKIILRAPKPFIIRPKDEAKARLINIMINNEGWDLKRVLIGLTGLYQACNH